MLKFYSLQGILTFLVMMVSFRVQAQSLDQFLDKVRVQNSGFKASELMLEAAEEKIVEAELPYAWSLFGDYRYIEDRKKTLNPLFQGEAAERQSFSLGLQKQVFFGLQTKLTYQIDAAELEGVSPNFFPKNPNSQGFLQLEVRQPLWRNFFGRETRFKSDSGALMLKAAAKLEEFKKNQILVEAETAYWNYAIAIESVKIAKAVLQRSEQLVDWVKKRVSLHLADRSDELQAKAGLQQSSVELKRVKAILEAAKKNYFFAIHENDQEEENLFLPSVQSILNEREKFSSAMKLRKDLLAAQMREEATGLMAESQGESTKPQLDFYAGYGMHALEDQFFDPLSSQFNNDFYQWFLGVSFQTYLDNIWSGLSAAYKNEAEASHLKKSRLVDDSKLNWENLVITIESASDRLKLLEELVQIQNQKLLNERERFKSGRSTTYQTILFEQDYSKAQLQKLETMGELLRSLAQVKLYEEISL